MSDEVRFEFGDNWRRLEITADRLESADASLRQLFPAGLHLRRFLDIGCGSGLFSLAAARQGAVVHSFDFDPLCVECARALKAQHGHDVNWTIEQGSVLDSSFLERLGLFDVVYSWGVLHHTGDLWTACGNAASRVGDGGQLVIAIYNDQGWRSKYWKFIKRQYCSGSIRRAAIVAAHLPLLAARVLSRLLRGQLSPERGMSLWRDYLDWLGGYPFEVASRDAIVSFHAEFDLTRFCPARSGCNEFSFRRR